MVPVILESPFAGDVLDNIEYAKRCMFDSLVRGEAPFASHLLYPALLDDLVPAERELGILAGFAWRAKAEYTVFYENRGWSPGMLQALDACRAEGRPWVVRRLNRP